MKDCQLILRSSSLCLVTVLILMSSGLLLLKKPTLRSMAAMKTLYQATLMKVSRSLRDSNLKKYILETYKQESSHIK